MKTIKATHVSETPKNFTGIVEFSSGTKFWYLEGIYYKQISLENYIVLDSYKGKYNLVWYKLLGKDEIFDYPEILGLIEK